MTTPPATMGSMPTTTPLSNMELVFITIARLAITAAFRIIYPLQPFLMGSLHVDLATISMIVTVQLLASLISPLGGTLADLRGERTVMSLGLGLFCIGTLACASSGVFLGFLFGYALIGLGMAFFQPAAASYLSARTSYAERGRVLGIYESSWAGAALLGVAPLMLLVQNTQSAALVYWILFGFGIASFIIVRLALPPVIRSEQASANARIPVNWSALRSVSVVAVLVMQTLVMSAYDVYAVIQSPWLKQAFGANEARLGEVLAVTGIAELVGVGGVILLADRLGKRRSAVIGYIAAAACLALIPLTVGRWEAFLAVMFLFFVAEEFAIVAALPLISGVAPQARATLLSLTMMISSIGRAIGAAAAPWIWQASGIWANAMLAAILTLLAALLCGWLVREREAEE